MRYEDRRKLSPEKLHAHKKAARDYARTTRLATKTCSCCKNIFPNDEHNFAVSQRGVITKLCLGCHKHLPAHMKALEGPCPICTNVRMLKNDLAGGSTGRDKDGYDTYVRLCSSCLLWVNNIPERMDRTKVSELLYRLVEYVLWRELQRL